MSSARRLNYKFLGMNVFDISGQEWVIGTDKQMDKAASDNIKEELWAFNADFIVSFLEQKQPRAWSRSRIIKAISKMQGELCEDAQDIILALLEPYLDDFVNEALKADGRGHFLSSYDGKEYQTKDIPGLKKGYGPLCFRIN